MGVADARLKLPDHLARFFEMDCMGAECFSEQWRGAVAYSRALIDRLGGAHAPDDILALLNEAGEDVEGIRREHDEIAQARRESGRQIQQLREQTQALWIEIKQILREADANHEAPPEQRLAELREERRELIDEIKRRANSDRHQRLQERYHEIVLEIQRRKLHMVADAHRTVGLEESNYRPPWWWFLAVDPDGSWLQELAETATMRLEPFGMLV
jgi:hypothetical protein